MRGKRCSRPNPEGVVAIETTPSCRERASSMSSRADACVEGIHEQSSESRHLPGACPGGMFFTPEWGLEIGRRNRWRYWGLGGRRQHGRRRHRRNARRRHRRDERNWRRNQHRRNFRSRRRVEHRRAERHGRRHRDGMCRGSRRGPDSRDAGPARAAVVQGQHPVRRHARHEHQRRLLLPLEHSQAGAALHDGGRRIHRNRVRQPDHLLVQRIV
jgi:hypothetical protein